MGRQLVRGAGIVWMVGAMVGLGCDESGGSLSGDLMRIVELPPGEDCPEGGLAVSVGTDSDGDGALSADEVAATENICNGEDGAGGADGADGAGGAGGSDGADGRNGGDGEDGLSTLIEWADEAPGRDCEAGGIVVSSGLDLDGDGRLDAEEITATEYVCDGVDGVGQSSLVSLSPEDPGDNCESGGTAIRSGLDANADGLLQLEEVDDTRYVCNGAPGDDGEDGLRSLVRLEDAGPGDCELGGQLVMTGLDEDDDGYLDDAEVGQIGPVCNGEAAGAGPHASLFEVIDAPVGGVCAAGGSRIQTGLDSDDDGALDPDEVATTSHVCNGLAGEAGLDGADGEDGLNALVAMTNEPAGANCAQGGTRVQSGLDVDGDGVLDPGEVGATRYVCNGAEGADGADGADGLDGSDGLESLVSVNAEPAGSNCAAGGQRVRTGMDEDGDGVLDAGEVDSTSFVCNGGGVVVRAANAAWGGVCARGGVRLESGVDDDRDGLLDDAEVDQTQYVCNLFISQIAAGNEHTCAVISNGTAACWGQGAEGQLGDGTAAIYRPFPAPVSGLTGVAEITVGFYHACARHTNGTASCWGRGSDGQLGDGAATSSTTPVPVSGLADVVQIEAGGNHTCAVRAGSTAACWGRNLEGQLGDGTTTGRSTPVTVSGLADVAQISLGNYHTCSRQTDSTARCWGYNALGQLGDGSTTNRTTPVAVSGLTDIAGISVNGAHSCSRQSDGSARCWGYNGHGELGDGTTVDRSTPVAVSGLADIAEISAGLDHTCSRQSDGSARCWGYNDYGQLGDGTTTQRTVPVVVSGVTDAADVSADYVHTCSLRTDGTALCWGRNYYGELGDDGTTNSSVPVKVLFDFAP